MLRLRFDEQGTPKLHELRQGTTLVGRLPTSDLVLLDPSVSRHHASFKVSGAECRLQDAGSRFGTFLNGEQVKSETLVEPGATIKLGEVVLTLEQHMSEKDLLSEDHQISEGPGTIMRAILPDQEPEAASDGHLIRLLSEMNRTLLTSQSLVDVLNRVVDLAFKAVPADRAFLMLRESAEEALTARVMRHRDGSVPPNPTLSRGVVRKVMRDRVAILAIDATTDPGFGVTDSILRFNIRSFMCAPLWSRDEVIGVLYVDSPRSAQFDAGDLDAFTALANAAAVAIEQSRLSSQLLEETRRKERLQRYHSPAVVSRIVHAAEGDAGPGAQERDVTVMFCDIVGFTTMCEKMPAAQSAAILNNFLTRMTDCVFEFEGTLDKFLGDALLAVFGAPFDQPEHPIKAVQAALAMRKALVEMNAKTDGPKLNMRIAINTGMAITGDIGSPRRREFTVLGDVVNTTSRIESEATSPGEIVISGPTYDRTRNKFKVRPLGARVLRGRAAPLELYAVEG